jgi:hypothetical protein
LTDQPPFEADTPIDTLMQVLHHGPVPPRQLRTEVPRELESVCLKCLEKEPERRYRSAAALGDDLRRFLAGQPVTARPVGSRRGWTWFRHSPVRTDRGGHRPGAGPDDGALEVRRQPGRVSRALHLLLLAGLLSVMAGLYDLFGFGPRFGAGPPWYELVLLPIMFLSVHALAWLGSRLWSLGRPWNVWVWRALYLLILAGLLVARRVQPGRPPRGHHRQRLDDTGLGRSHWAAPHSSARTRERGA